MSHHEKIHYIELPARDIDAAKRFYGDAFGWTFESYGPDYLAFNDGNMDGGFFKADLSSDSSSGAALVVLFSDTLEETKTKVEQHGGKIVQDIFSFPGGRRFHFQDPNGNELAVWTTTSEA